MGVLKVRSNGQWINVGVGGGPLPAGGVLGDILVKQSVNPSDALWGTALPKLNLTSATALVSLTQADTALMLGSVTTPNLVFDRNSIQARDNGTVAALSIQEFGGTLNVGGDSISQQLNINLVDSKHAQSRRAAMQFGSGWIVGQDLSQNGTKDFFIYNLANNKQAITIDAAASFLGLQTMVTIALAPTAWFRSDSYQFTTANGSAGMLSIDNASMTYSPGDLRLKAVRLVDGNPYFYTDIPNGYVCRWRRTNDYATLVDLNTNGDLSIAGQLTAPTIICNSSLNMGVGNYIRLAGSSDNSHRLNYTNAVPPGSGEACNGPQLVGWSGVWLHNAGTNKPLYLSSAGNVFIATGQSYSTMSSIENKENVMPLDPDDCLDQVARWRPVEFDVKSDGHHARGFIAEDHVRVTPGMVNVCGPDSLRPGWANAVHYSDGSIWLTGAVQALLRRIEQLEGKAA